MGFIKRYKLSLIAGLAVGTVCGLAAMSAASIALDLDLRYLLPATLGGAVVGVAAALAIAKAHEWSTSSRITPITTPVPNQQPIAVADARPNPGLVIRVDSNEACEHKSDHGGQVRDIPVVRRIADIKRLEAESTSMIRPRTPAIVRTNSPFSSAAESEVLSIYSDSEKQRAMARTLFWSGESHNKTLDEPLQSIPGSNAAMVPSSHQTNMTLAGDRPLSP